MSVLHTHVLLLLLLFAALLTPPSMALAHASSRPHFTLHPKSEIKGTPKVVIYPLHTSLSKSGGGGAAGMEQNVFTFGAKTKVYTQVISEDPNTCIYQANRFTPLDDSTNNFLPSFLFSFKKSIQR